MLAKVLITMRMRHLCGLRGILLIFSRSGAGRCKNVAFGVAEGSFFAGNKAEFSPVEGQKTGNVMNLASHGRFFRVECAHDHVQRTGKNQSLPASFGQARGWLSQCGPPDGKA